VTFDEQNRYEEAARALKEKEKKGGGKMFIFLLLFAIPTLEQKRSGCERARAACLRTHRNVITRRVKCDVWNATTLGCALTLVFLVQCLGMNGFQIKKSI
jgi:hypothetical protein